MLPSPSTGLDSTQNNMPKLRRPLFCLKASQHASTGQDSPPHASDKASLYTSRQAYQPLDSHRFVSRQLAKRPKGLFLRPCASISLQTPQLASNHLDSPRAASSQSKPRHCTKSFTAPRQATIRRKTMRQTSKGLYSPLNVKTPCFASTRLKSPQHA